jgi:hypothetical protein
MRLNAYAVGTRKIMRKSYGLMTGVIMVKVKVRMNDVRLK